MTRDNMPLSVVEGVPTPSEGKLDYSLLQSSTAFDYDDSGVTQYLCYELTRDFLSAPRQFVVIQFDGCCEGGIRMDVEEEYGLVGDDTTLKYDSGLYRLSSVDEEVDGDVLIFIAGDHAIEFVCERIEVSEPIYRMKDSQSALVQYMRKVGL
jgi:hypothetical protein